MRRLAGRRIARGLIAIFLAYSIGYLLICALPQVGVAFLGISASDPMLLEQFQRSANVPTGYLDALVRLITFDFGLTLDRVEVAREVARSVRYSVPLFLGAVVVVTIGALLGYAAGGRRFANLDWWLTLGSFFPAYVPAFVVAGIFPAAAGWGSESSAARQLAIAAIIAFVPAVLTASLVRANLRKVLAESFSVLLDVYGYGAVRKRVLLLPTVLRGLLPSLEKIVVSVVVIQLFVEATLALPGIGTSLIRALQRSDVNLLLAYITLFSTVTVSIGASFGLVTVWLFGRRGWA